MTFSPSSEQAGAIAAIKDWFWHRRDEQQVFRLFGYAGSGKSTLTAHAIAELGLDGEGHALGSGGVLYGAFTGKAALVMTRKGTPASTIHSRRHRASQIAGRQTELARSVVDGDDVAEPPRRAVEHERAHREATFAKRRTRKTSPSTGIATATAT